jgi:endonuclease/exonuclease/phosphatase family metal-dependent hydrolase
VKNSKPPLLLRIISNLALLINMAAIVWLCLCIAAAYTSPVKSSYLTPFSLSTPFAIATNALFVIFWLLSSHKLRAMGSLILLAAGYKVTLSIFGFNYFGDNDMISNGHTLKIMTWNVHGIGIFNKPRDKAFEEEMLNFIKQQDADILCLPEYSMNIDNVMKPHAGKIINNNGYADFRFQRDNDLNGKVYLGTAVFSKYPFRNYEAHQLSQYIYMLQGDVLLPGNSTVRMFFVHLTTFGLSDKDKDFIDDVKAQKTSKATTKKRIKEFLHKFNKAYQLRGREVEKAAAIIKESPYPVLLSGDFNDLPASYAYTVLRGRLNDAFLDKGKGLGRTYNRISPTLRIDHMLYDPAGLKLIGFNCPTTRLSDHNPIITNFEIVDKARP